MENKNPGSASSGSESAPRSPAPGPDVMLGVWSSSMDAAFSPAQQWSDILRDFGAQWWQVTPDSAAGDLLASNVKQLNDLLAKDPVLRAIDQLWNANPLRDIVPVDWAAIACALRSVWLRSLGQPGKTVAMAGELNTHLLSTATSIWTDAYRRWSEGIGPGASEGTAPATFDKRFAAPEWHDNPAYRMLKETYLLASDWLLRQGETADIDDAERQRLNFHLRQFVDAMSPTLLLVSNPEALRRAIATGGASLADGARNLLHDLKEGRLTMVDATAFAPGRNLALTPGKVVYRNKLMELIQYAPATATVRQVPLLVLPPWINKYYILDMQPKNSMVRYLVEQGFTVFVVSWKNPDSAMDGTTIEDYMDLGPLAASDVICEITGVGAINVMGYCIGGTLLAMTLAWLAAKRDRRFGSATFIVSLQDFSKVGDTAVFLGEPAIDFIEQQMMQRGYLDSREMSNMFNLLRSNDLIWSNVVNNYLLGQPPPAFDLLYWNSDGTRMTRAAHSWYLHNTYVENNLIQPGRIHLKGEALDLGQINLDAYAVGAEKDHIVPWDAAWRLTRLTGGKVRFVLASSGHIAGIINPPGGKGSYWVNDGNRSADTPEQWRESSSRHDGSWWTDWARWLSEHAGRHVKPPAIGSDAHPALDDAPGRYVLET
jgi:polyhydroxyalkanoate synthase subunit PhaC